MRNADYGRAGRPRNDPLDRSARVDIERKDVVLAGRRAETEGAPSVRRS